MTYIFYDTETSGKLTAFDQILQFAAIKTDAELNVVDTFNVRCRLLPYIVPSPGALLVTGATVAGDYIRETALRRDACLRHRHSHFITARIAAFGYQHLDGARPIGRW